MSANSLITKEEKAKQYNAGQDLRARPGKPLSKGSLAAYQRKDSGEIAEDLVSLWEKVKKNDPPAYRKIERAFTSSKPEVVGRRLKCTIRRYWVSGSPDAYKSVLYSLSKFLE